MKFSAISIAAGRPVRPNLSKILLIMKLTTLILIIGLLQVSAKGFSQITLNENNVSIKKVLASIEKQSGFHFFYNADQLKDEKIDIRVSNATLDEALAQCFKNTPFAYKVLEKNVVIQQKLPAISESNTVSAATTEIHGVVRDDDGKPLAGVTVLNKISKKGAVTDAAGNYVIAAQKGDVLVFSFVGYSAKEIKVGDYPLINVSMVMSTSNLNDVVVIGYGTTERKDLTGAVSTIAAADVKDVPFNTIDNALAGKAAGVQVTKSDGTPGGAVRIRIRGTSSLLGGNDPLYIIDGVPLQIKSDFVNPGFALSSPLGNAAAGGNPAVSDVGSSGLSSSFINGLNSLGGLNPDDIESITILKDASSTAIYGSKAANGVVIITTKRGKANTKPQILASYYSTVSAPYNAPKLLDATQFKELFTEAAQNQQSWDIISQSPLSTNADLILNHASNLFGTANTNWIKEVTRNTVSHNAELSVEGGGNSSKYFNSISYTSNPGIVKGTDFQRISGKINLENNITDKFRIITNIILGYTNQNLGDNAYAQALFARPDLSPYNANGSYLNFDEQGEAQTAFTNPVALLTATNNAKTFSLLGSLSGVYDITQNLQFKTSGSLNYNAYNQRNYTPSYLDLASTYGNVANTGGIGSNSNRRSTDWFWENTLTYNKQFNKNNSLNVLVGQSFETTKASFFSATATGYPNDNVLTGLSSAVLPLVVSGDDPTSPQSYLLSFYTRANYSLMDKYLFTFTGRTDGSSKFGINDKFGWFPSGAVAWRISQENFLKNVSWIDDIKLRGSYGLTGNQNIGDQMYRTLYSPKSYNGVSALIPTQLGNSGIKWETTKEADGGIDISLFKERLTATVDYFNKQTSGDLLSLPIAPSSSYTSLLTNAVGIRNNGWEVTVGGDVIRNSNFRWSASVNATFTQSIVTHLSSAADLSQIASQSGLETIQSHYGGNTTLIQGKPIGLITGRYVDGIIKTQAQADAYQKALGFLAPYFPAEIGDPMMRLDPSTAAKGYEAPEVNIIIANGAPKYYGGITQNFAYKNFSLNLYFTYSVGGHLLWAEHAASTEPGALTNADVSMLDRYTPQNTNTNEPRLMLDYSTYGNSNLDVFSSSYLKLRTLTLNYNLSKLNWIKNAGLKNTTIFASATNLFTITKYPGSDPEVSDDPYSVASGYIDVNNYPQLRTFSIGIKTGF